MELRNYYNNLFRNYPDLLSFGQLQEILGGMGKTNTRSYLDRGYFKYYQIEKTCYIPKVGIIDYLLGNDGFKHSEPSTGYLDSGRRKPGSGCLYKINDHLWEGKYSPRNAHGKRISRNVYAKTRKTCEKRLMKLIYEMNREIIGERIRISLSSTSVFSE